jgi:hypothetical protein
VAPKVLTSPRTTTASVPPGSGPGRSLAVVVSVALSTTVTLQWFRKLVKLWKRLTEVAA